VSQADDSGDDARMQEDEDLNVQEMEAGLSDQEQLLSVYQSDDDEVERREIHVDPEAGALSSEELLEAVANQKILWTESGGVKQCVVANHEGLSQVLEVLDLRLQAEDGTERPRPKVLPGKYAPKFVAGHATSGKRKA